MSKGGMRCEWDALTERLRWESDVSEVREWGCELWRMR